MKALLDLLLQTWPTRVFKTLFTQKVIRLVISPSGQTLTDFTLTVQLIGPTRMQGKERDTSFSGLTNS